ncbi:hypothetical protein GCM10020358_62010 [Amorphoplanes nipponensis]
MLVVPRPAESTDLTKTAANASATSAKAIATMTNVTFELSSDPPLLSAARVMEVPDINVLLYTDCTRAADETAGRTPCSRRRQPGPADAEPGSSS